MGNVRNKVLQELIERNPNGFRLDRLPKPLQSLSHDEIKAAIEELEADGVAETMKTTNRIVGRDYLIVKLSDISRYPIVETLNVNGREYPRMVAGDTLGGDDLNFFVEVVGEIEQRADEQLDAAVRRLTRRYWVTTSGLFSALLAVFALILRASEPFDVAGLGAREVLLLKAAELGPLAIVLFLFVALTYGATKLP